MTTTLTWTRKGRGFYESSDGRFQIVGGRATHGGGRSRRLWTVFDQKHRDFYGDAQTHDLHSLDTAKMHAEELGAR